jgi:hypothetical protein
LADVRDGIGCNVTSTFTLLASAVIRISDIALNIFINSNQEKKCHILFSVYRCLNLCGQAMLQPDDCRIKDIWRYLANRSTALCNDKIVAEISKKSERRKQVLKMVADKPPSSIMCRSAGG